MPDSVRNFQPWDPVRAIIIRTGPNNNLANSLHGSPVVNSWAYAGIQLFNSFSFFAPWQGFDRIRP